jgi:hypothetical protein
MSKLSDKINDGEYCYECGKPLTRLKITSQQKCKKCPEIDLETAESIAWERNDEEQLFKSSDMENEF